MASDAHYHASRRGFTAVEVLMAVTLMVIGAMAVMSMQKASVQGNLDARKTDMANAIARTWVERLRRDAMQWTSVPSSSASTSNPNPSNLGYAKLLASVGSGWVLPSAYATSDPQTMSYAFDILGRDLAAADITKPTAAIPVFCVNVRLQWLVNNDLLRADVRVLWPRAINSSPQGFCQVQNVPDNPEAVPDQPVYHALYMTTALAQNPASGAQ